MNKDKNRKIYDDDFYKISAALMSKKFLMLEESIKNKYKKNNLSIPKRGFVSENRYGKWLKKALKLSPTPGKIIENILTEFKLDKKNENLRNYLSDRLFFNILPWQKSRYTQPNIELIIKDTGKSKSLWVKIKPWTKKRDYIELWKSIKNVQKRIPGYRGKEKFQTTFERNFAVYQLYLEVRQNLKESGNPKKISVAEKMESHQDYESIVKQFKKEDFFDNLRSINSQFNKLLSDVDIL